MFAAPSGQFDFVVGGADDMNKIPRINMSAKYFDVLWIHYVRVFAQGVEVRAKKVVYIKPIQQVEEFFDKVGTVFFAQRFIPVLQR